MSSTTMIGLILLPMAIVAGFVLGRIANKSKLDYPDKQSQEEKIN